jgi:hypothetical protein
MSCHTIVLSGCLTGETTSNLTDDHCELGSNPKNENRISCDVMLLVDQTMKWSLSTVSLQHSLSECGQQNGTQNRRW